jgi:hypothetical protein
MGGTCSLRSVRQGKTRIADPVIEFSYNGPNKGVTYPFIIVISIITAKTALFEPQPSLENSATFVLN